MAGWAWALRGPILLHRLCSQVPVASGWLQARREPEAGAPEQGQDTPAPPRSQALLSLPAEGGHTRVTPLKAPPFPPMPWPPSKAISTGHAERLASGLYLPFQRPPPP